MKSGWPEAAGLALLLALQPRVSPAQALEPVASAFVTTARSTTAGILAGARWRPGESAPRLAATLGAGTADGELVGRMELAALLMLPRRRDAEVGWYLAGGIAGVTGPEEAGWILALVGLETNPAGESGLVIEAGIGGGFRAALGWRWRRRRRAPKSQPPRFGRGGEPSRAQGVEPTASGRRTTGWQYRSPRSRTCPSCSSERSPYRSARYCIVSSNQSFWCSGAASITPQRRMWLNSSSRA